MSMQWYCTNCEAENDVHETIIKEGIFYKKCKCTKCPAEIYITPVNTIIRLPLKEEMDKVND